MNPLRFLCRETDTDPSDWEEIEGPQTRVGIDSWFHHEALGVWVVNDDQGHLTATGGEPD